MHLLECVFILEHCTALRWRARLEILVSMDISVLAFYGYIGYIGDISVDIFL